MKIGQGDEGVGVANAATTITSAEGASGTCSSRLSSASSAEENDSSSLLLQMLAVDLIATKLLSFLTLSELKVLSAVSWDTLWAVRKLSDFSNLARLHLSNAVLQNGLLKLGEGEADNFIWRNVSLDLAVFPLDRRINDSLRVTLERAESLDIYDRSKWSQDRPYIFRSLEQILETTQRLKVLGLEVGILNRKAHPGFFANLEIRHVLKNLHGLVILGARGEPEEGGHSSFYNYYFNHPDDHTEGRIGGKPPFYQNMMSLARAPLQLKKLSFTLSFGYSFNKKLNPGRIVASIIKANRRTLEVIEVCHIFLKQVEAFEDIHCPNLKSLRLLEDGRFNFYLEDFLSAQPPLEDLGIHLDRRCDYHFILGLMETGKLSELKRLSLDCIYHSLFPDDHLDLPKMDWQFLAGITPLKDFSLAVPNFDSEIWHGIGEEVLRSLPPTTEKISLRGIPRFWMEKGNNNIGLLLSRFQNLKELDLSECYETVNDEGLQTLIVNCPRLTSLVISNSKKLTDFGLTGVPNKRRYRNRRRREGTGISLDQLKGLVHLRIENCRKVTREGLLAVLNFKHLRSFLYSNYRRGRKTDLLRGLMGCCSSTNNGLKDSEFLFRVAFQNPSLERVKLCPFKFDPEFKSGDAVNSQLRLINPRVKVGNFKLWR